MVALGLFFAVPEAESEALIRLLVGHQNRLIYEACLLLQDRHDLLRNSVAEFACLARFAGNFNDSRIHGSLLSVGERCERNVAQEARRPLFCWDTTLRCCSGGVNQTKTVQRVSRIVVSDNWPRHLPLMLVFLLLCLGVSVRLRDEFLKLRVTTQEFPVLT